MCDNPHFLIEEPCGRGHIAILLLKRPRKGKSFRQAHFWSMKLIHQSPEEEVNEDEDANEGGSGKVQDTEVVGTSSCEFSSATINGAESFSVDTYSSTATTKTSTGCINTSDSSEDTETKQV